VYKQRLLSMACNNCTFAEVWRLQLLATKLRKHATSPQLP